jgi:hypothetical protein
MKFLSLTTDNGITSIKAAKKLGFVFQPCVGHTQQLCIDEALEYVEETDTFITKMRALIKHFS